MKYISKVLLIKVFAKPRETDSFSCLIFQLFCHPQVLIKTRKKSWHDTISYMTQIYFMSPIQLKLCIIHPSLHPPPPLLCEVLTEFSLTYIWYSKKWFLPKYTTTDIYLFNPDIKLKYFSSSFKLCKKFVWVRCEVIFERQQVKSQFEATKPKFNPFKSASDEAWQAAKIFWY